MDTTNTTDVKIGQIWDLYGAGYRVSHLVNNTFTGVDDLVVLDAIKSDAFSVVFLDDLHAHGKLIENAPNAEANHG